MGNVKTITLNNGVDMPLAGYGVFRIGDDAACEEAVVQSVQAGYRLIDTAAAYGNEGAVGRAIARCGIAREDLFVTTKLWVTDTSYEGAHRGFERSCERLGLDYVDLYLIHQPYGDYYGAWRALEELYAQGRVRAIGADNFTQEKLADFLFWNDVKPAVNLVECNPYFQRESDRAYMSAQGVAMQAWSPLAAGQSGLLQDEALAGIARAHGKTSAQVVLRWLAQRGIAYVVKSTNSVRMKENLEVFDFELTSEEMARIALLDTAKTCFAPRTTGEAVTAFLEKAATYEV